MNKQKNSVTFTQKSALNKIEYSSRVGGMKRKKDYELIVSYI